MRARWYCAAQLLLTAVVASEYVPVHKRFSYDPLLNDFTYLGMLSKRDACSDAFGDNASNSNCAPDQTLCCTRSGQTYPSCQQYLGKGWCCVGSGDGDNCYVDQESVCDEQGSVECTNLADGYSKACCPKLTTCDDSVAASNSTVRCNILRNDLLSAASESISATASVTASLSTASATHITSEVHETSSASETPTSLSGSPNSQSENAEDAAGSYSDRLSGGAIAGIVIGAVAGLSLIAGLVFWLRRRSKAKHESANQVAPLSIPQFYQDQQMKQQGGYYEPSSYYGGVPQHQGAHGYDSLAVTSQPSELEEQRIPVELDGGSPQLQPRSR